MRDATSPLALYIARIGAEQRNFRRYVVSEKSERGYHRNVATITLFPDGTIKCPNKEFAPTDEEAEAIAKEIKVLAKTWPTSVPTTTGRVGTLCQLIKKEHDRDAVDLFVFKNTEGNVVFVQERILTDDAKTDLPWSFWSDSKWRNMEPDGLLPLYGLDQLKGKQRVFIHEGAKTARCLSWMSGEGFEATEGLAKNAWLKDHPWRAELKDAAHIGWPGGAPNPHRVDWEPIRNLSNETTIILVCDNDQVGIDAATEISRQVRRPMTAIIFDDRFPPSWDLADELPIEKNPSWRRGERWAGPSLDHFSTPATWATDIIPQDKGRPSLRARKEFSREWLVVATPAVFVHRNQPQRLLNPDTFNRTVRPFSDAEDTARLLSRIKSCHVDGIAYLPGERTGIVVHDGQRLINTFRPSRIKAEKGESEKWHNFMTHLIPDEGDRYQAERWCATLIARPDIRMRYGILLISQVQGVGKGTLGENILAPLVGLHNTSFPSERTIADGTYNGWMAHRRLAVVHEMYSGHSRAVYDRLKSAITDTRTEIKRKYIEEYEIDICVHVFACSNSMQALHLDDEDRRWFVPRISENKQTPEYWRDFHGWLREGGLGIIRRWAEEFIAKEGAVVETGDRAPSSSAKTEVIVASRSAGQQLVFDLVDYIRELPLKDGKQQPVLLAVEDVRDWVASKRSLSPNDPRMEKPLTIRKALIAAGLHEPEQIDGKPIFRAKVRGRMSYVVANFPLGKITSWADLSPSYKEPKDVEPKDVEPKKAKEESPLRQPGDFEPF